MFKQPAPDFSQHFYGEISLLLQQKDGFYDTKDTIKEFVGNLLCLYNKQTNS